MFVLFFNTHEKKITTKTTTNKKNEHCEITEEQKLA